MKFLRLAGLVGCGIGILPFAAVAIAGGCVGLIALILLGIARWGTNYFVPRVMAELNPQTT